jgi:hypothetical protein
LKNSIFQVFLEKKQENNENVLVPIYKKTQVM